MPMFTEPTSRPIPPPATREAPTSARSKPVNAPSASSIITQTMPAITSSQLTQLPTERLLPLHAPRTIASVRLVFNDSSCSRKNCVALLQRNQTKSRNSFAFLLALFRSAPGLALRSLRHTLWFLKGGQFAAFLRGPARFIDLAAARDSQSIRGDIFRNGRTRGDVSAVTHADGRHQRRVAADENLVPNRSRILVKAVVIARDRACADVALRSDFRVTQVG